jgi:hypothetical protein
MIRHITDIEQLLARPGQRVKPKWRELAAFLKRQKIRGGKGILVRELPDCTLISLQSAGSGGFRGVWHVTVTGDEARIGVGRINQVVPTLNGRRLDGLTKTGKPDPQGPPRLRLRPKLTDKTGQAWIAVRVRIEGETLPAKPENWPADALTIEQVTNLTTPGPGEALYPLALMRAREEGGFDVRQIAYFDVDLVRAQDGRLFFRAH